MKVRYCVFSSSAPVIIKKLEKSVVLYSVRSGKKGVFSFSIDFSKEKEVDKILSLSSCEVLSKESVGIKKYYDYILRRTGLLVGAFVMFCVLCLSNAFVLDVKVCGSGAYYEESVQGILASFGIAPFRRYQKKDVPDITAKILSLPFVSFCSLKKQGTVLIVEVETSLPAENMAKKGALVCDEDGTVEEIVVLRGSCRLKVGDRVKRGDELILPNDFAMGKVGVLVEKTFEYLSRYDDDEKSAQAALLMYIDGDVRECKIKKEKKGENYLYTVEVSYVKVFSINLG